jgi:hypothetical protein
MAYDAKQINGWVKLVPGLIINAGEFSYNYPYIKLKPSRSCPWFMSDLREYGQFYTTVNELSFSVVDKNKVASLKIEQNSASVYALKFNGKLLTTDRDNSKAASCLDQADKLCPQAQRGSYGMSIMGSGRWNPGFSSLPDSYLNINGYDLTPYLVDGVNKLTFSSTFETARIYETPEITIKVQGVDFEENWTEFCDGGTS